MVIIVCADRKTVWTRRYDSKQTSDIDGSIVTDHMMLQAADLGVDSLWLAAFDPEVVHREFNIPEYMEIVSLLALGYNGAEASSPDRHDTQRKPIEETVFYEKM